MVKRIPLSKGMFALVDEVDYPKLATFKWHAMSSGTNGHGRTWYAVRSLPKINGTYPKVFMHRQIMGVDSMIDHKDGNGLNNTRDNLRPANRAENNRNIAKPRHGKTSIYKGVYWDRHKNRYKAALRVYRKNVSIGYFRDQADAAWAYDREARKRFGAFAFTNFPSPPAIWKGAA